MTAMRPYLAIIKDSFREALASRVLWVLLALITVTLLGIAPLTYREQATVGLRERDVEAWPLMVEKLRDASQSLVMTPAKRVWSLLDEEGKKAVREFKKLPPQPNLRDVREMQRSGKVLFKSLDKAVRRDDFYDAEAWKDAPVSRELKELQKTPYEKLSSQDRLRENRMLMEAAFPDLISSSSSTSLVFRYAIWNLGQPFPIRKQQFVEALFKQLPWLIDKGILSLGLLIAVLVTAPIIPQMLDAGSLHLLLSKPIARPLLYISKFLGGCAFVLAGLATADLLNALFLRKSRSRDKRTTYESGETPIGGAWIQFPLAFYVFALLFVAFDVDIVFILGWAVIFQQLGWFGFAEISFFILTLAIGLVYAWRKGVIRWI